MVTATDFVPQLFQAAARRAQAEGLELETWEADAQSLPFPDGAFDAVLSTFGVMFTPTNPAPPSCCESAAPAAAST